MVLIQAEYFLHFAQNISFLVKFSIRCARTFIPAENGRNSSLVFQIFPATELVFSFLRAKMFLTHFSVFRQTNPSLFSCLFIAKATDSYFLPPEEKKEMKY